MTFKRGDTVVHKKDAREGSYVNPLPNGGHVVGRDDVGGEHEAIFEVWMPDVIDKADESKRSQWPRVRSIVREIP